MSEYDVIFNMRVYGRPDGHPIHIDPLKEAVEQFVKEQCVRDGDVIEVRENSGASTYFKVVVGFEECDRPKTKDEEEMK